MKRLTAMKVLKAKKAKPGQRNYVQDSDVRQLSFMITDTGHKSFVLYTRLPGRRYASRLALGQPGVVSLEEAREEARRWLNLIKRGLDPRDVRKAEAAMVAAQRSITFGAVVEDYIRIKVEPRLARPKFIADTLRNEFVGDVAINGAKVKGLGEKPVVEVTWLDLKLRIDEKRLGDTARGAAPAPVAARHLLATVKAALNWAVEQEAYGLTKSVAADKKLNSVVGNPPTRERVLTDAEMRAAWAAAGEVGYPFGSLVQMLLMTAQRRDEVSLAKWSEFEYVTVDEHSRREHVWSIPGVRMKKRKTHVVPIGSEFDEFLKALKRKSTGEFVFSTTDGDRPFSGFSKAKKRFDEVFEKYLRREIGDAPQIETWVLHDIRRSVRTRMSRFTSSDVAELVINHQRQGVRRIYDRYDYLTEKREALDKWQAVLRAIVHWPV